jgi:hypothetical protein
MKSRWAFLVPMMTVTKPRTMSCLGRSRVRKAMRRLGRIIMSRSIRWRNSSMRSRWAFLVPMMTVTKPRTMRSLVRRAMTVVKCMRRFGRIIRSPSIRWRNTRMRSRWAFLVPMMTTTKPGMVYLMMSLVTVVKCMRMLGRIMRSPSIRWRNSSMRFRWAFLVPMMTVAKPRTMKSLVRRAMTVVKVLLLQVQGTVHVVLVMLLLM